MAEEKIYQAIVGKIIPHGRHGPYAVAHCDELSSVTFSLNLPVWQEGEWPEAGTYVLLSQIRKKRAGWLAKSGRFLRPFDEQRKESKVQNEQKGKRA